MSAVKLWLSALTASDAYKALLWLALLLAASTALTVLPVTWLAMGVVGLGVAILTFVRPQTALYLLCFSVSFGSLLSVDLGGISVGITDALLGLAVVAWLARTIAFRQPIRWPRLALPALLFVGAGAFSLLHAQSLPLAAKELAKWIEFLAVLLIVTNVASRSKRQSHVLVACLLLAGVAQAALGAYQFLTRSGPEFFAFGRFLRAYGTFEQPNPFGGYMGLIAPLALALLLSSRSRGFPAWLKGLALVGLAGAGAGIAMSGSRGAWLGAAAALGIVTLAYGRQGQLLLMVGILVIGTAGVLGGTSLIPDQVLDRITGFVPLLGNMGAGATVTSIEVTDANYANLERLAFWQAAADMWADRLWLGVGIGNYQAAYAMYSLPKWRVGLGHAHNYYLNIAAETGLLGLSAYLALWATVTWWLVKTARAAQPAYTKALALGALGVVIHASVHNLVDNLWVHHLYIHSAIILGLAEGHGTLKTTSF
jgi:O-antigen ligase